MTSKRSGFALLAVLWIMVGLSALALATNLAARQSIAAATNRVALAQAQWRAEGCVEEVRATAAQVLGGELNAGTLPGFSDLPVNAAIDWSQLDRVVASMPRLSGNACQVVLRPTGRAVDVNVADGDQMRRLFLAVGLRVGQADSLADAILDWRDADDVPRANGAERDWYAQEGRFLPRNGPLADVKELRRVRGYPEALTTAPGLDTLLTTEPGSIVPALAPPAAVASLPGPGPDYARLTTNSPDAWIVTAFGRPAISSPVTFTLEVRLVRAGQRPAIIRRRELDQKDQPKG